MSEKNLKTRQRQRLLLGAAGVVAVGLGGFWVFGGGSDTNEDRASDLRTRRQMSSVLNPPDVQEDFLSETGTRLRALETNEAKRQQDLKNLANAVMELTKDNAVLRAEGDRTQREALTLIEELAGQVASTDPGASAAPTPSGPWTPGSLSPASGDPIRPGSVVPGAYAPGTTLQPSAMAAPVQPRQIKVVSFTDADEVFETDVLQPAVFDTTRGDYVPPNAYATATVLVGVDMSTGVTLAADPKPVLLRITGPARSVIDGGRQLDTDLAGCLVNGSAHAELSSERVYVRLHKITCDRGDGVVAESTVDGYVSQLGKVGVRGRVVSREGDIVEKALIAGTIGGFGRGISRTTDVVLGSGTGGQAVITNDGLSAGDIATGGLGEGISTAADTVSDYLIDRAEQYQPVIEMPTGVEVELVFQSGFYARGVQ